MIKVSKTTQTGITMNYYLLNPQDNRQHMTKCEKRADSSLLCSCDTRWFSQLIPEHKEICFQCGQLFEFSCDHMASTAPWYKQQQSYAHEQEVIGN